jgi:uncharacterized protein (TIGR00645 family)
MVSELTKLNLRRGIDRLMFATRWIAAPIYIVLFGALCIISMKFADKMFSALSDIFSMTSNQAILLALTLIDLVLVANLVIMVMFAAWENFVSPLRHLDTADRPNGLRGVGFNAVKLKVIASAAAIAVIQLLETFVHIDDVAVSEAALRIGITLCIPLVGVMLAWMDRIAGPEDHHV